MPGDVDHFAGKHCPGVPQGAVHATPVLDPVNLEPFPSTNTRYRDNKELKISLRVMRSIDTKVPNLKRY